MAAIGKIRSYGVVLAIVIGLALFAFIAEELARSCGSTRTDRSMLVGKIYGKRVTVQEYQSLFEEYQEVMKLQKGSDNLTEEEANQARDYVWNTCVQGRIVAHEAQKLGLTVTDEELQEVLNKGTNPMLRNTPFANEQTGLFDANELKKFLAEYKLQKNGDAQTAQYYNSLYRYWTFVEKTLRQQILAQKYQALFSGCFLTNEIETKALYEANNTEAQVLLAAFPYNDISDDDITITEAEKKQQYDNNKGLFRQYSDTRDVKYIDVVVTASDADRKAIADQFATIATELATTDDAADVVRRSTSTIPYLGLPVKKNAYSNDISAMLDSLSIGETSAVFETKRDNTLNVMKLLSKQSLPDSVQYRQIQVFASTPAEAHAKADSVYNAIIAGGDFELIAKNYGQTGEATWLTTAQYQRAPSIDVNTKQYLSDLNTMAIGETKNLELEQGNIIYQVVDRRAFVDKYVCAVVKKTIDFSHETYSAAYNKFSAFVSANQSGQQIIDNAEDNGYVVREVNDLATSTHILANIRGTQQALRWAFDAKEDVVSPMYECGDNDHLLVLFVDKINKTGYRPLGDSNVDEQITTDLTKEKKSQIILSNIADVKTIADAEAKGAKTDTIPRITFASPVFVRMTSGAEATLAGAVAATDQGAVAKQPVVGEKAVFLFQVINKTEKEGEYDAAQMQKQVKQKALQAAGNVMNALYLNAEVIDKRYVFF